MPNSASICMIVNTTEGRKRFRQDSGCQEGTYQPEPSDCTSYLFCVHGQFAKFSCQVYCDYFQEFQEFEVVFSYGMYVLYCTAQCTLRRSDPRKTPVKYTEKLHLKPVTFYF